MSQLEMAVRGHSYWLDEAFAAEAPNAMCAPLAGAHRADVCIVGGGYTGLWTALTLKEHEPSLDVALIEARYCGYGASGRNGGFLMSWSPKFAILAEKFGLQDAVRLNRLSCANVAEIGAFCADNSIDCEYRRDGWLWIASNKAQENAWRPTLDLLEKAGESTFVSMDAVEARRRVGSNVVTGAIFEPGVASVQPAKLVRGLRRIALAKGVRIFEGTPMTRLQQGRPPIVHVPGGRITASRVVLALNAWAGEIPRFRLSVLQVAGDQFITEPIPDKLSALGLHDGMCISDSRLLVFGARVTKDGRLNFWKAGGDFVFGGRIGTAWDTPARRGRDCVEQLGRIFPSLADVKIAASWRGQVTRTTNGLPFFGSYEDCPDILYGHGYCGNGVGPSRMGGKILASLALGLKDEWSSNPLVSGPPKKRFPPEPFRYLGAYMVRSAVARKEAAEDSGRKSSTLDRYLASLAPAGLVPLSRKTKSAS
jgi:putative aminophosphonate oxidoreductase